MRLPFDGEYKLSQTFGVNPDIYSKFIVKQPDGSTSSMKGHNGLDWAVPNGTVIKAPFAGKVIEAFFDKNGYGNYIKLENNEEGCVLAHLEKVLVSVGHTVKEGESIAISDNTGYSTGPHLHMGYYRMPRDRANGYGGFVDPLPYIVNTKPQPTNGPLHSDEEYQAAMKDREKFWQERDAALCELKELQEKFDAVNKAYTGFAALGYNTVDDVNAKIAEKEAVITGINTQLVQVLRRNEVLAETVKAKEHEDVTAIEEGLKAAKEADKLKGKLAEVHKTVGVKPAVDFEYFINYLKKLSDEAKKRWPQKPETGEFNPGKLAPPIITNKADEDWFIRGLGLGVSVFMIVSAGIIYFWR